MTNRPVGLMKNLVFLSTSFFGSAFAMTSSRIASWSFLFETLVRVLGRDHHRVDAGRPCRRYSTVTWLLPSGRSQSRPARARLGELAGERVRELDRHRHQLGRLVAGVAEHHALVAGAAGVHALGDVGRLLVERDQHAAGVAVEAHLAVGVADPLHHLADEPREVDVGAGRDLAGDHHEAGLDQRLAGHAAASVLREDRVEDGVRDLVGDLVGMAFGDGLGGEEVVGVRHRRSLRGVRGGEGTRRARTLSI